MDRKLVPHHSHWGAFLAEVEGNRVIGVRPFARDPDPSALIEAIPAAVHAPNRIAQPMVREGFLARGPGPGEGAVPAPRRSRGRDSPDARRGGP